MPEYLLVGRFKIILFCLFYSLQGERINSVTRKNRKIDRSATAYFSYDCRASFLDTICTSAYMHDPAD